MAARPVIPDERGSITAAWLQQVMVAGGAKDFPTPREVTVEKIGAGVGTTAQLLRCPLTYHEHSPTLPPRVIVTMHSKDPKALRANHLLSIYRHEYTFYHDIQPHAMLVRSPHCSCWPTSYPNDCERLALHSFRPRHTQRQSKKYSFFLLKNPTLDASLVAALVSRGGEA